MPNHVPDFSHPSKLNKSTRTVAPSTEAVDDARVEDIFSTIFSAACLSPKRNAVNLEWASVRDAHAQNVHGNVIAVRTLHPIGIRKLFRVNAKIEMNVINTLSEYGKRSFQASMKIYGKQYRCGALCITLFCALHACTGVCTYPVTVCFANDSPRLDKASKCDHT